MKLFTLNYDNLASILNYLSYIDIFQLNCAILCSNSNLLRLFKQYLQTMHIEQISIGFVNTNVIFYKTKENTREENNIREYTQILLWAYTYEIPINKIELLEENGQLDENANNLIDTLFKIPTNCVDILCNTPLIIYKLHRALLDSNSYRAAIQTLILDGMSCHTIGNILQEKTDLIDWPILINLKRIELGCFHFLSDEGAKNILNRAPNLKSLKLTNDTNILNNLQLILSNQILDVTLHFDKISNLNTLKKHFSNTTYLQLLLFVDKETNLDNFNRIELPELIDTLDIEILEYNGIDTNTDIIQILKLDKLMHLKNLKIHVSDLLEVDIMSLIQLPNLINLHLLCPHNLKNEQYLAYLSKKVNVKIK